MQHIVIEIKDSNPKHMQLIHDIIDQGISFMVEDPRLPDTKRARLNALVVDNLIKVPNEFYKFLMNQGLKYVYRGVSLKSRNLVLSTGNSRSDEKTSELEDRALKKFFLKGSDVIHADRDRRKALEFCSNQGFLFLFYDVSKLVHRPDIYDFVYTLKKGVKSFKQALIAVIEVRYAGTITTTLTKAKQARVSRRIREEILDMNQLKQEVTELRDELIHCYDYITKQANDKENHFKIKKWKTTSVGPLTERRPVELEYIKIDINSSILVTLKNAHRKDEVIVVLLEKVEEFVRFMAKHEKDYELRHFIETNKLAKILEYYTKNLKNFKSHLNEAYKYYREINDVKSGSNGYRAAINVYYLVCSLNVLLGGSPFQREEPLSKMQKVIGKIQSVFNKEKSVTYAIITEEYDMERVEQEFEKNLHLFDEQKLKIKRKEKQIQERIKQAKVQDAEITRANKTRVKQAEQLCKLFEEKLAEFRALKTRTYIPGAEELIAKTKTLIAQKNYDKLPKRIKALDKEIASLITLIEEKIKEKEAKEKRKAKQSRFKQRESDAMYELE